MRRARSILFGLTLTLASSARAQDDPRAWQRWKAITSAIAIAPLDGPEELLEKAEIIADRVDRLTREKARLTGQCSAAAAGLEGVREQVETLEDVVAMRGGPVTELRQRLHALRSRRRALRERVRICRESLTGLSTALTTHTAQHADYLRRVEALRREESPPETP